MTKTDTDYLDMQRRYYEQEASTWSLQNKNPVVGWYDFHEASDMYDVVLFRGIDTKNMIALDYGCGPGRLIIRFHDRFKKIDGIDISRRNLANALINIDSDDIDYSGNLLLGDGQNIPVDNSSYDMVYSVICMQHIASHKIRMAIMKEVYRVLVPGGWYCFQMGCGNRPDSVGYYDNAYDAPGTNGVLDTRVDDVIYLESDLNAIGFRNIDMVKTAPIQDLHDEWVWVKAQK